MNDPTSPTPDHAATAPATAIADIAAEAEALKDEARTLNLALERFRI